MRLLGASRQLKQAIHLSGTRDAVAIKGAKGSEVRGPCYHTAQMRSRGLIEATLVVLAATVLTVLCTYPVAFGLSHLGRTNTDDGRWSIWVVSWVAHALTSAPSQLYHANIFYPHRYALAFSEANLGAGVIGMPAWLLTGNPYTTHNVAFLAAFVMACCGAYYLCRHLTGSRHAAAVAGVLFGFCPFIFARTAHIQLLFIGTLPFCLLAFHRLVEQPTVVRAALLGVLLWMTALTCAYYGIFAGLMVGLGTIFFAWTRRLWRSRDYWIGIALAGFTSVGLTVPFFVPYLTVQNEMGFARTLDDARAYSANLQAWGASAAWAHRWWLPALDGYNEVLFPGIIATTLGIAGAVVLLRRAPPHDRPLDAPMPLGRDTAIYYLLIAALACWSSFGPDAGLYQVFYSTIPVFTFLRAPGRMGIMVTLSLTVLASGWLARSTLMAKRPDLIASGIVIVALIELATLPLAGFRDAETLSPVYRQLASLPRGAVVEFPYWYERSDFPRHAYYMLNSTAHWQPLVNGYSDHIPADFRRTVIPLSSFPSRESFGILARADARYVVFHLNMYNTRLRERLFERLKTYAPYLRPLSQEGQVWLYEIVGWPN